MPGVLKSLKIRPQDFYPFTHLYVLRRTLVAKAEIYCGKQRPGSVGRPPLPHVLSLYFLHPWLQPNIPLYYSQLPSTDIHTNTAMSLDRSLYLVTYDLSLTDWLGQPSQADSQRTRTGKGGWDKP